MEREFDLAGRIIGCAMKVHRILGPGFLESVYQNALLIELRAAGLKAEDSHRLTVTYEGHTVDDFIADIFVEDEIIVENKACNQLLKVHEVSTGELFDRHSTRHWRPPELRNEKPRISQEVPHCFPIILFNSVNSV